MLREVSGLLPLPPEPYVIVSRHTALRSNITVSLITNVSVCLCNLLYIISEVFFIYRNLRTWPRFPSLILLKSAWFS